MARPPARPPKRQPSWAGIPIPPKGGRPDEQPATAEPPPRFPDLASKPPLEGDEAEEFWDALFAVEGRALLKLGETKEEVAAEMRSQLDAFRVEMRDEVRQGIEEVKNGLHAAVVEGLQRDFDQQKQIADLASREGRVGGKEAGGHAGRIWGAAGGLFALIIAAVVLALLHKAGVPIPGAVESAVAPAAAQAGH